MKKIFATALTVLCLAGASAHAKDVGDGVQAAGQAFDKDARRFGSAVKTVSSRVKNKIVSGTVQVVTGPSGEAMMLVGDVSREATDALASMYKSTRGGLRCLSEDPANPFKDGGCVVQYAGKTLVLAVVTLDDGSTSLVIATAEALSSSFNGLAKVMNSVADDLGRTKNPVGALFVLAYHVTNAGETVIRFGLVDVVARSISILVDEGTDIITTSIDAMYDLVTLKWGRAAVKIVNGPEQILNAILNVPIRILFGHKAKDVTLRILSPFGNFIDNALGIDPADVEAMENAS